MGIIQPQNTRNTRKSSRIPGSRFERSALHQKRRLQVVAPRNSRSVWTAVASAPLSVRIVATRRRARSDVPYPCANSQGKLVLPRLFKRHPPEPVAARGEPDQHILERWREQEPLQPFCPGQPPRKRGVATAGDSRLGFGPRS